MNYYIADLHLGHANIIKHSKRPFDNVLEMDKVLIENWNRVITDKDDVYILGDLAFRSHHDDTKQYLFQLKGKKHLIVGNHDDTIVKNRDLREFFVEIRDYKEISDNGYKIVLCHYPLVEWNGYYRNTLHFYGHIHNNDENATSKYMKTVENAYNVGADVIGFTPRTFSEIVNIEKLRSRER